MKKHFLFAVFLFSGFLYGQTNTVDSLKNLLTTTTDSTEYLHILKSLAFRMHRVNPDSSLIYSIQTMELSKRLKDDTVYATAQYYAGIAQTVKGNYTEALKYTLNGLENIKKLDVPKIESKIIISLGILYEYMGEIDKAIECNGDAIKLARKTNDSASEATVLNNWAILLINYKNDYEGALEKLNQSLEIRRKLNVRHQIASSLNNIGEVYMMTEKYDPAIKYYREALDIYQEMNDKYGLAVNFKNVGKLLFLQKKYDESLKAFQISLRYAKELKLKQVLVEDYEALSKLYADRGNFKDAYLNHIDYCTVKDSIYNENSAKQIAEMKTKYETEKAQKEKELSELTVSKQNIELKQQKLIRNGLITGIILILIILLLIFNSAIQRIIQKTQIKKEQ